METGRQRILLDAAGLARGLDALAARLRPLLAGRPVTVVPVLGGAFIFAADLLRRLPPDFRLEFIRIQTYGAARAPQREAQPDWTPDPQAVRGRTILLVDDVLDTGRTLAAARAWLLAAGAAEVRVVVCVDKPARRAAAIHCDDCLLRLDEDLFLVGYGLDLAGAWRGHPDLMALEAAPAESAR